MSDDILTVLSVMGKVTIEKFREIFDILHKQNFNEDEQQRLVYTHNDILKDLEAMGHCEVDYSKRKVFVCPPSFALLPWRGLPKIVLTGGRSVGMVNHLLRLNEKNSDKMIVRFSDLTPTKNPLFPKKIIIEGKSIGTLKQVIEKLGIEGNLEIPASNCLSISSPSISEINNLLTYNKINEPNWKKAVFCREKLHFRQFDCLDEFKLVSYTNPMSQQQYTFIWYKDSAAVIDRQWGRYFVLQHYKTNILLFDPIKKRFAVPSTIPLPKQLARAAIFSTGNLPRYKILRKQVGTVSENINITVYDGVADTLALEISKKLGQELLEAKLN
ncbi:hypothetical protein FC682_11825 [Peribacillus simplex]|uniref:hypothetical protein n=1 Tax=Peribacillus simplex TaxID=1478 RepID=UPI0010BED49F|nr:hypothetical protein [Peribacillus simplex]TKH04820.1 hypothetical protein FC682_11825 [Peribacillus simplex]